jgi:metal-dependent amidase/aminoacylase/carboxypeptidase family protein
VPPISQSLACSERAIGLVAFQASLQPEVPGAYVWLGQGRDASSPQLHDPAYDFNDEVLPHGAALLAALVESRLAARHVLP